MGGTASGLAIFDSEHSRFSRFDLQDSRQPDSRQFIGKLIMVPGRTGNNLLFVITGGSGIYVIDTGQQTVLNANGRRYTHPSRTSTSAPRSWTPAAACGSSRTGTDFRSS
jgi:hypothetical protein